MAVKIDDMVLLSLQEITEDFDISLYTLRKYIRKGRITAKKFGRTWYVPEKSLKAFFNKSMDTQS